MLEINSYSSTILHDISFSLKENENLIILGENGAGKSTLAKVLSNLISNNNVKLFGENIDKIADLKRAKLINYIPPKLSIFDEYVTLKEFLELSSIDITDDKKMHEGNKPVQLFALSFQYHHSKLRERRLFFPIVGSFSLFRYNRNTMCYLWHQSNLHCNCHMTHCPVYRLP